ncbi:MAG: hypothetical protein AAGC71_03920 [Pseudomonadota bacterium]
MARRHTTNRFSRHLVSLAYLTLGFVLSGCTALPGVGVPAGVEPRQGWTEAQVRDTYGSPGWVQPGPDGTKVLYFKYKTAPTSRMLTAATAITTFGLVRDAGSLEYQLVAIIDSNGQFVCADRARIAYALVSCEHERRLAVLDALPATQRADYDGMLRVIDPKKYIPGYYAVVDEAAITADAIQQAIAAGTGETRVADDVYYFNAECYLLTRWYVKHLEAAGQEAAPAQQAAVRFANGVYTAGGSRGMTQAMIEDDVSLWIPSLRSSLDRGNTSRFGPRAKTCVGATSIQKWLNGMGHTDRVIYQRITDRIRLARSLAVIDQKKAAEKPDDYYYLRSLPIPTVPDDDVNDRLTERKALEKTVTIDALAEPLHIYDALFTEMLKNGQVPPRDFVRRLMRALDAKIALGDHDGAAKVIANIGRYYLAHAPNVDLLSQGADVLVSAASLADYIGDHQSAASLALMAGEVRLHNVGILLAENGLASEESRDAVREIINFVPYSYERTAWNGTVTRYRVDAPLFDSQGMLSLISTLGRQHTAALTPIGYAVSRYLPPSAAGRYFMDLARQANEGFSSRGASGYYLLAHIAYDAAGNRLLATEAKFYERVNYVASRSTTASGQRSACNGYKDFREEFDSAYNAPSKNDVKRLFGEDFYGSMRKYDRRCGVK